MRTTSIGSSGPSSRSVALVGPRNFIAAGPLVGAVLRRRGRAFGVGPRLGADRVVGTIPVGSVVWVYDGHRLRIALHARPLVGSDGALVDAGDGHLAGVDLVLSDAVVDGIGIAR